VINTLFAHVGGLPIEETIGSLGAALLVAFGVALAQLRARLRRVRFRASTHLRLGKKGSRSAGGPTGTHSAPTAPTTVLPASPSASGHRCADTVRAAPAPAAPAPDARPFLVARRRRLAARPLAGRYAIAALGALVALVSVGGDAWASRDDLILVSRASGASAAAGNDHSGGASVSDDGRLVAFASRADNLSDEDNDVVLNVFVRDLQAGTTTLVSRASGAGGPAANSDSGHPSISADGRFVAFHSSATNLSANDGNGGTDVFVRDLQAATTTLVSRANGPTGAPSDGSSGDPSISADGRFVAFGSTGTNLSDEDAPGDFQDVFVRDLQTNTTTLVSRASATGTADGAVADSIADAASISVDGRFVAFVTRARNLSDDDRDATDDVFVRDLQAKTTTLVSRASDAVGAAAADRDSGPPSISGDGRFVAFASDAANLDENNLNVKDVFVRDTVARTTTLVSRASGPAGTPSDGFSADPSISADGRFVAFESEANVLTDANRPGENIYVRDRLANTTALVSRASGAGGAGADGTSISPAISGDGRFVAFDSDADNLSTEDNDAFFNVFARDLAGMPPEALPAPGPDASGAAAPVDTAGPALSARALTRANRTIRVGRDGRFRLFCGRFAEPVTGRCGGASKRRAGVGKPRARLLDLGMRAFRARAGARVLVRFRLSRARLKRLRAARKVRMNGIVVARDARGNAATARFVFTLKAPPSPGGTTADDPALRHVPTRVPTGGAGAQPARGDRCGGDRVHARAHPCFSAVSRG
jgi:Tol biopolymer transport system component